MSEINQKEKAGERLREERKRLGFTQDEFATIGGLQKQAVFNYEKGIRSPDADYLRALADVGVDVQYVITGKRSCEPRPGREEALLDNYRAADEEGKRMVERLAHSVAEPVSDGYEVKVQERQCRKRNSK